MRTPKEMLRKMVELEEAINEINSTLRADFEEESTFRYSKNWEVLWSAVNLGQSLTSIKIALGELIHQYYGE